MAKPKQNLITVRARINTTELARGVEVTVEHTTKIELMIRAGYLEEVTS